MHYYLRVYLAYLKIGLKTVVEYRADFWISTVTMAIHQGMTVMFISIIFTKVRVIEGWGFYEVVLIYGLVTASRSLSDLFLRMPWAIHWAIIRGQLDIMLVRPPSVMVQIIGESAFMYREVGPTVVGVAAIVFGFWGLDLQFQAWWTLYIPAVLVSGALIAFAIKLVAACLGFWFVGARSMIHPLVWLADFAQFPVVVYPLPILLLLTWVVPYAMMGFYPAAFLVRGEEYKVLGMIAPLVGWVFLGVGLLVWGQGIRRYESTGS